MGEEEKKGNIFIAVTGSGRGPIRFDGLQEVSLETEHGPDVFYSGVDISEVEDFTGIVTTEITPQAIYHILGFPLGRCPDFSEELERFKTAMWPMFETRGKIRRKRFKKLLMSHGVNRNLAEEATKYYNEQGIPYFNAYKGAVAHCWIQGIIDLGESLDKDGE